MWAKDKHFFIATHILPRHQIQQGFIILDFYLYRTARNYSVIFLSSILFFPTASQLN